MMIRVRTLLWGLAVLMAILTTAVAVHPTSQPVMAPGLPLSSVLILDAGHGGMDGGAVSQSGIVESELNLEITKRLALLMVFCGQRVALTRIDSGDLSSADATTIREKKASDLKNRVAAINAVPDAMLISIHQNSLPEHPSVHGAQVFYNKYPSADLLAAVIQEQLNRIRNINNEKLSKQIDTSIYLMNQANCPAVLVECGFLSNSGEAEELRTPDCQKQMILAIAGAYLSYTSEGMS